MKRAINKMHILEQKLKNLMLIARNNRNVLTSDEVKQYFKEFEFDDIQFKKIYDYFENNNVDILFLNDWEEWKFFDNRLKELLKFAVEKSNIITKEEVKSFFCDIYLEDTQIDKICDYLEENNVDIFRIDDCIEEKTEVKLNVYRPNKYATEEERVAARKKSMDKYRRKRNQTNEFALNRLLDASNKDQYDRLYEDWEFLKDIGNIKDVEY